MHKEVYVCKLRLAVSFCFVCSLAAFLCALCTFLISEFELTKYYINCAELHIVMVLNCILLFLFFIYKLYIRI